MYIYISIYMYIHIYEYRALRTTSQQLQRDPCGKACPIIHIQAYIHIYIHIHIYIYIRGEDIN